MTTITNSIQTIQRNNKSILYHQINVSWTMSEFEYLENREKSLEILKKKVDLFFDKLPIDKLKVTLEICQKMPLSTYFFYVFHVCRILFGSNEIKTFFERDIKFESSEWKTEELLPFLAPIPFRPYSPSVWRECKKEQYKLVDRLITDAFLYELNFIDYMDFPYPFKSFCDFKQYATHTPSQIKLPYVYFCLLKGKDDEKYRNIGLKEFDPIAITQVDEKAVKAELKTVKEFYKASMAAENYELAEEAKKVFHFIIERVKKSRFILNNFYKLQKYVYHSNLNLSAEMRKLRDQVILCGFDDDNKFHYRYMLKYVEDTTLLPLKVHELKSKSKSKSKLGLKSN